MPDFAVYPRHNPESRGTIGDAIDEAISGARSSIPTRQPNPDAPLDELHRAFEFANASNSEEVAAIILSIGEQISNCLLRMEKIYDELGNINWHRLDATIQRAFPTAYEHEETKQEMRSLAEALREALPDLESDDA